MALLTNLVDRKTYPYEDVVSLYLKKVGGRVRLPRDQGDPDGAKGRVQEQATRSRPSGSLRTPLGLNLLRLRMAQAARLVNLSPNRLSFRTA